MVVQADRTLVLDTTAFILGYDPSAIDEVQYSVPSVQKELHAGSAAWLRFDLSRQNGNLRVEQPTERAMKAIEAAILTTGDLRLSSVDKQVLALALDLRDGHRRPIIVSDDYALQNVAETLGVSYTSLATFGIRYRVRWYLYCPACFRRYQIGSSVSNCDRCGTPLKRKFLRKSDTTKKGR